MSIKTVPQVVLVEDNADDEFLSLRGFANSGVPCKVIVCRDGEQAINTLLKDVECSPALVVLDYNLPKFNGLQVLTKIRRTPRTRLLPVVIFSGDVAGTKSDECYRVGVNSWVPKPADPVEYAERLTLISRYWLTANYGCVPAPSQSAPLPNSR